MAFFVSFFFLFFLISSSTACDRCVHKTKVAYFSKASALSSGACGYGSLALGFSSGHLAAGVASLYKDGAGCGACFQIRCKNTSHCTKEGTIVTLTDLNRNNQTDFVISSRAFMAMAQKGMGQDLLKLGIVDVEYKRVPCQYKNQNLAVRVEESSQKPNYLAVKFLYQGGQTEIVGVDVAQVGSSNWGFMSHNYGANRNVQGGQTEIVGVDVAQVGSSNWGFMSHNYGAVWDTSTVPSGALQFRFVITAGYDGKYIWAQHVLLADWKSGVIYDSGVQFTDIAQEGCSPCDDETWK